jgi:signal peptide peptidase SppA
MTLLDLLTSPWAMLPDRLAELHAIYATHLRGDKIDVAGIEARLGRPLANEQQTYALRDGGVAVLPIAGVLAPKANLFMQISGGQSMQMLARQVQSMQADSRVRAVVLAIDSPGGSVLGTPALAAAVRAMATEKPTVAVSEGTMASAAYWVASAANAVFAEGPTDQVGSIGVYARFGWDPRSDTSVEMVRGRYKRLATNGAPPDPQVLAHYEGMLDHLYATFVDAVADHRGVSADDVLEHMADGRIFVGTQAVAAGLVDGIAGVDDIAEQLATTPQRFAQRRVARIGALAPAAQATEPATPAAVSAGQGTQAPIHPPAQGADPMATTQAATPAAANSAPAAPAAAIRRDDIPPALAADLRAEGAAAERDRIAAVRAQSMPGHEALIERLAADGTTTGPEAAVQILTAERARRTGHLAALDADAPPAAPAALPAPDAAPSAGLTPQQVADRATVIARERRIDVLAAIKLVQAGDA